MMRIIFMGTPAFAIPSLKALLDSSHEVIAVVTVPDAMGGRGGKQLIQSEVKLFAESQGLRILQPERFRSASFIQTLKDLNADVYIVVAFRMLPEKIWSLPPKGTYNVHGSLLPKYRGAAPIHWAVIQGEKITGVTVFKLKHEIDSGDIVLQSSITIGPDETTGDVYEKLKDEGARLLVKSLELIDKDEIRFMSQVEALSCPAPKLFHDDCEIQFEWTVSQIHNFIRGLHPKPSAWIIYGGIKYFIHRSALSTLAVQSEKKSGALFISGAHLLLKTVDGQLEVIEIQPEGKRKMTAIDFVHGVKTNPLFL